MKRLFGTAKKEEAPKVEFGQVSERMDQRTSAYETSSPDHHFTGYTANYAQRMDAS